MLAGQDLNDFAISIENKEKFTFLEESNLRAVFSINVQVLISEIISFDSFELFCQQNSHHQH